MRKEALERIIDMLETEDEITETTALDDVFEWDSLAALSYIALAKKKYGKTLDTGRIKQCTVIGDLVDLLLEG